MIDFFPLIEKDRAVSVAVSGGSDSMALCWLLARAIPRDVALHALTVDHGLRPESAAEAKQVGLWLERALPFVRHVVLKRRPKSKTRIMESAREDRYALMADYCGKCGIKKLFVAHHSDDQAETVLFRLAKGSGLDGLAGMRERQEFKGLTLLRPLLQTPKSELISLCREQDIPFITDPSNENQEFARPRLRAALEREGAVAKHIATTARRLGQARDALEFYAQQAFGDALQQREDGRIALRFDSLASQPEETRLRVLRHVFCLLADDEGYGPRFDRLEVLVDDLFGNPFSFRRRTLNGLMVSLDAKRRLIVVEPEKRK